jgi:ribonuclease-3
MAGFTAPRKFIRQAAQKITRRERREKRGEFRGGDIAVWTREYADHAFTNISLLNQARSHRSWCAEHPGNPSNERLEFLGDAILQWIVTDLIYAAHPAMNEGELTDLRKSLVNAETLAEIAKEIQLGQWIQLGAGELTAGGRNKSSILADSLEALIGALYLDGGADKTRSFVASIIAFLIIITL